LHRLIHRTGRLAGALLLSLLLAACSVTVQTTRLQQSPPAGLPAQWELVDTPFFAQQRYQCGPAALAMMLVSRGIAVQPDDLVDRVYLPARQGSVTIEMEAAARHYGQLVYPLAPRLDAVLREVAAGNPVLVLQNLGLSWYPKWHYAVVVGYDLAAGTVILRSGVTRRYLESMGVFETTWRRSQYWARVILPPEAIPETAEALPYTQAVLALEQSHQTAAAQSGYRSATARWPDHAPGWLARGNLAYRLQAYAEAAMAYRGGLAAAPRDAALWNNLGYALAAKGCQAQALAAVNCALQLAPGEAAYRDSLSELQGRDGRAADCEPVLCPISAGSGGRSLNNSP